MQISGTSGVQHAYFCKITQIVFRILPMPDVGRFVFAVKKLKEKLENKQNALFYYRGKKGHKMEM